LEAKFDKDKVLTESKLLDQLRENNKLKQQNSLQEERLQRLEEKLQHTLTGTHGEGRGLKEEDLE